LRRETGAPNFEVKRNKDMSSKILVLGLGNILLQDEGLGVHALQRLASDYQWPPDVEIMDGGTKGLDLLPFLEGVSGLLILDAVQVGEAPGTLIRLEGSDIPKALSVKMSMHQVGLQELLALGDLQGILPPRVVLLGLEPAVVDWGLDLSPSIADKLKKLVEAAVKEVKGFNKFFLLKN
jgi:hydrogenase maturation protease